MINFNLKDLIQVQDRTQKKQNKKKKKKKFIAQNFYLKNKKIDLNCAPSNISELYKIGTKTICVTKKKLKKRKIQHDIKFIQEEKSRFRNNNYDIEKKCSAQNTQFFSQNFDEFEIRSQFLNDNTVMSPNVEIQEMSHFNGENLIQEPIHFNAINIEYAKKI